MSPKALVDYPDSDSDGGEPDRQPSQQNKQPAQQNKQPAGKEELPPLPSAFHDLYTTNARTSTADDPSLHGGRKRAVPHVDGNWPSHVYLEWIPSRAESELLQHLIASLQSAIERANKEHIRPLPVPKITPSLESFPGVPSPLHISLSRTLQIKTDDREEFLDTLTACLRKSGVNPFDIRFSSLKWVPNFERNRWFLVLGIEKLPGDELNRLLGACNTASDKCGYPGLYTGGRGDGPMDVENERSTKRVKTTKTACSGKTGLPISPSKRQELLVTDRTDKMHVTIAWNLVEPAKEWIALARNLDVAEVVKLPHASFDVVKAKVGNVVHSLPLRSKLPRTKTGGGMLGLG